VWIIVIVEPDLDCHVSILKCSMLKVQVATDLLPSKMFRPFPAVLKDPDFLHIFVCEMKFLKPLLKWVNFPGGGVSGVSGICER
jgi:hypothetical protein